MIAGSAFLPAYPPTDGTGKAGHRADLPARRVPMFEELRSILSKVQADYADIRYETKRETKVTFNGKELTQIGSNTTDGYVLRVLKKGGMSSIAFTRGGDAERAIRTAEENALLISRHLKEPVKLARTAVARESFKPPLEEDPRRVSTEEKLELTRRYNDIPLRHEAIATTTTDYLEITREKYFLTTEGSEIREDLITTRIGGLISSRDGTLIQNVRVGIGGSHGFALLRNQEEEFEKKTSIALQLLTARPVEAGVYNVVLNPSMAGVFTHEAFGHFSEADLIEDAPTLREKMQMGAQLGNDVLSITDDPTLPKQLGFYKYDDEGVAAKPTKLMDRGVLKGRLHSRRTAAAFGEPLSGHCVAEDYRYAPIIRMGNIFIEPSTRTLDELQSAVGRRALSSRSSWRTDERRKFHLRSSIWLCDQEWPPCRDGSGHQHVRKSLSDLKKHCGCRKRPSPKQVWGLWKRSDELPFLQRRTTYSRKGRCDRREMMEKLLEMASRVCDQVEIYSLEEIADGVSFENAKLKEIDSTNQCGLSLRMIKDGKLGFAYTKNLTNREELLQNAMDSLKGGVEGLFDFPFHRESPIARDL